MDNDLLARLVALPSNEAHNLLMSLNLPTEIRTAMAATARQQRDEQRKAKKRSRLAHLYHAEQWHALLAPLKYELSNADVGLRLKGFAVAPERYTAFNAYVELLNKLLAGLNKIAQAEADKLSVSTFIAADKVPDDAELAKLPSQIAKERKYPNNGAHWSDWVNEATKQRINTLFDAIPYTPRAKRFTPFKRRLTPELTKNLREALAKRTANEALAGYQELRVLVALNAPTPQQRDEIEERIAQYLKMVNAVNALLSVGTGNKADPVPSRWQDVDCEDVDDWDVMPDTEYASDMTVKQNMERLTARLDSAMVLCGLLEPKRKKKTARPKRYMK